ncbi:MAG: hypothetical protein RI983_1466 [Bacteroidota bacterium]|jgi:predicted alpha/beta hydrolase family esterase
MINYLIVPGLGNSGPEDWQTYFENSAPNFTRIQQSDWDTPACKDWIKNINDMVTSFDPPSIVLIGFNSIVVASSNDIWVSLDRAKYFAEKRGSGFINIGDTGHINVASGHTNWEEGLVILKKLM